MAFEKPIKTHPETDILKDSQLWDYSQFLHINQINKLTTTIWSNPSDSRFALINLIGAVMQMEFMCWSKIAPGTDYDKIKEYKSKVPEEFRNISNNISSIDNLLRGDEVTQLRLLARIIEWEKALDRYMSSMKRIKRVSFMGGKGPVGEFEEGE